MFCGRNFLGVKRGLFLGIVLLAVWVVVRHGLALWLYSPDGHASLWRFFAVTFAVWIAPGLCWFRWGIKACPSSLDYVLGVLAGSVTTSGLLVWSLYFLGLYTVSVAWILVVALVVLGLVAFPWHALVKLPLRVCRSVESLSWVELLVLSLLVLFGVSMWVQATGSPLTSWDAIISWDKWACDMAERQGFGSYLLGGYPQLLPSLCSVSYKLAGSWGGSFPDEPLLMHGYAAPFAILLLIAFIRLCRAWEVPWVPGILLCVSIGSLQKWWISGYVDVPATALIVAATALLSSLARGTFVMKNRCATVAWIGVVLFGVGFIKGYGLMWVMFIPILAGLAARRAGALPVFDWKLLAAGVGLALVLMAPFYSHQRFLTNHIGRVDSSPRLHTFTVQVDKSAMYDRSLKAGSDRIKEALDEMGAPREGSSGWIPPTVRRVMIGVGIVAGCLPGGAPLLGVAAAFHWWVWEKTAAYDWRNALPALVMFCFLCGLGWGRLGRRWGSLVGTVAAVLIAWPWLAREVPGLFRQVAFAGSRKSVSVWAEPVDRRLRSVAPHQFVARVIAEQSPLGKRAHLFYAPDELYRHLGRRGVYTLKGNVFTDVQAGDLLLCNKNDPEPLDFTPIATVRLPGYARLLCCKPVFTLAVWSVAQSEGVTVSSAASGVTVKGRGWLDLKIDSLVAADSGDSILLAVQFKAPEEAAACSLELPDSWDTITNIRSRVCPVTDGVWIRTWVWLDRGEGFVSGNQFDRLVRLRVNTDGAITLVGIQAELLKNTP